MLSTPRRSPTPRALSCLALGGLVWLCLSLFLLVAAPPAAAADNAWLTDVDEAFERAAASQRHVLVDLYADWCGWCKVLEKNVFTTPEFRAFAADYVLLRVDVEDGGDGSELQARYGASSLPTTLILDSRRVQIGSVRGYAPAPQFIRSLRAELARHQAFLADYERVRHSDDPAVLDAFAEDLHRRGDGERAAVLYERLEAKVAAGSREAAWLHYRMADAYRLGQNFGQALQNLSRARALAGSIGDAVLGEQVDILSFYIAQDSGNCPEAVQSLERFLERHPKSSFEQQARRTLNALKKGDTALCA